MSYSFRRFYICVILVLFPLSLSVFTQKKEMNEAEFQEVLIKASQISNEGARRTKMYSEHFERESKRNAVSVVTEDFEDDGKGDTRSLRVHKGKMPNLEREERIIGSTRYLRQNSNEWVKSLIEERRRVAGSFSFGVTGVESNLVEKKSSFRYMGRVSKDGEQFDLFETDTYRHYQHTRDFSSKYTIVDRYWIDLKGRYFKRENKRVEADGFVALEIVWRYEYPEDLKIEAPIP